MADPDGPLGATPARLVPRGPTALDRVAEALAAGAVVAVPTDTVYGLAVRASLPEAAATLSRAKGRDEATPTQVLVADRTQAEALAAPGTLTGPIAGLLDRFWPGGLTVVLPRRPGVTLDLGGQEDSVGLRCPDDPWLQALCRRVGPLAATSANRHGEPPLTTAEAVVATLGEAVALVVDGGVGGQLASSVLDLRAAPRVLREGAIPSGALLAALGDAGEAGGS